MKLTGEYTWVESEEGLELSIPLKGTKPSQVDLYAAKNYVKINYGNYLLELDLAGDIQDTHIKAVSKAGVLLVKLKKAQQGRWGSLVIKGDKAALRARRQQAVEERTKREEEMQNQAKDRRVEIERTTLRAQMAMEHAERQKIDDLKAEEKARAEEEVYRTFADMEAKRAAAAQPPPTAKVTGTSAGTTRGVPTPSSSGSSTTTTATPPPGQGPTDERSWEELEKAIFSDDDVDDDEDGDDDQKGAPQKEETGDELPEEEVMEGECLPQEEEVTKYVPAPRKLGGEGGKVKIGFTPRLFPTPMRESKRAEEEDWIARNRPYLHKNKEVGVSYSLGVWWQALAGKVPPDAHDISEMDPVWLKGKGDDFYRSGDYHSATNAYTASLDAKPDQPRCLSNRAACYLHLGKLQDCLVDCTKALDLAGPPPESSEGSMAMAVEAVKVLRTRLHVRRGTAYCQLGDYERAVEDYRAALYHSPGDMALALDHQQIQRLLECSKLKRAGDEKCASGDLTGACDQYSQALSLDPSFISCLSNRAACYMALNKLPACVEDCTTALSYLEVGGLAQGEGRAMSIGALPPPGSERRKVWCIKTVARRGAARLQIGDLEGAREDFCTALRLKPGDGALEKDLKEVERMIEMKGGKDIPTGDNDPQVMGLKTVPSD